jgi:hypothetical protein
MKCDSRYSITPRRGISSSIGLPAFTVLKGNENKLQGLCAIMAEIVAGSVSREGGDDTGLEF